MKKNKFILIFSIAILVSVSLTLLFYSYYNVVSIEFLPYSLEVSNKLGFNLNTDTLNFGKIPSGAESITRPLEISNIYDFPVVVKITQNDNSIHYQINPPIFEKRLQPHESLNVSYSIKVDQTIPLGNYSGNLKAVFKRW